MYYLKCKKIYQRNSTVGNYNGEVPREIFVSNEICNLSTYNFDNFTR